MVKRSHYTSVETYGEEWAEQQMSNFLKYPPMQVWDDSLKYVFLTLLGRLPGFRPKLVEVESVRTRLQQYMAMSIRADQTLDDEAKTQALRRYRDGIEAMWPKLQEILLRNKGLLSLMLDGGGVNSLTFAKFPVDLVPHARALESAWGNNFDNAGVYRQLDRDDLSARYAVIEQIFVELRRRTWFAQQVIKKQQQLYGKYKNSSDYKTVRVFSLGAGLLVEFRKFSASLEWIKALDIIACDMDETLKGDLDTVFQYDFGVSLAETGIDYRFCAVRSILNDKTLWGTADVVLMDGVLSYVSESEMLEYVNGMNRLLKPNGVIVCDLQIMDPSLIRCAIVHEWKSSMKPESSVKKANAKMERICHKAGLNMTASPDPRNPKPLGVIYGLTLPKST